MGWSAHIAPGLVSMSRTLAKIDELTRQLWKWLTYYTEFIWTAANKHTDTHKHTKTTPKWATHVSQIVCHQITLMSGAGLQGPCTRAVNGYIKANMTIYDMLLCWSLYSKGAAVRNTSCCFRWKWRSISARVIIWPHCSRHDLIFDKYWKIKWA